MRRGRHSAKRGNAGRNILVVLMALVFLGGLCYALFPVMTGAVITLRLRRTAEEFIISTADGPGDSAGHTGAGGNGGETPSVRYPELLAAMRAYNENIFIEGQAGLCDAPAYEKPAFDLAEYGIEDGVIGVLSVPSISLEMPVYLGATYEHMAAGAAHLSQTSVPIGGKNTNCVIAGHRGWQGAPYFLNLDRIAEGDEVTLTNLWETLTYRVCGIRVIEPDNIDAVLIQPGRDMLTLITCHPYASGGRYRLVIYCERAECAKESAEADPRP